MSTLGPAGAWEIASTRTPPFISKPDKHRSSGGGPANEDYNIMACRICINRFWLVGSKAIILNGFPLIYIYIYIYMYIYIVGVNHRPWMPINTQTKDCAASMRLAWIALLSPNNLFESWTDTLQKSIQSWCIPFVLQIWYHIRANEMPSNWRHLAMRFLHANLMYRMHLPYTPSEC